MTVRRFAALAQALAIAAILAPGPHPGGPAPVAAAAAGTGIGCTAGIGTFRGPGLPGDPPAPPDSRPEATPAPVASDEPAASPDAASEVVPDGAEAGPPSMILVSASVRLAQADPSPAPATDPSLEPAPDPVIEPDPEPGAEPTPRPQRGRQVRGIDVSHHNGDIDYDQVLKAGRSFAFLKATQDTSFRDPMYELNVTRARQAGVYHGAYHFFDYTLDGTAQADHFLDRIEAADGLLGALPPVVDVECWRPSGVSTHVTAAARLQDFVTRVYERTARLPIVYTSVFMWDQVMGNPDGFEHLPLWAACWGCAAPPSMAPGWEDWHFWQTGVGRIPNVGRLDANVFNGTVEELDGLRLRPFRVAEGAPAVGSPELQLDLGGRDGDRLRTSLDGVQWSRWQPIRGTPRADLAPVEGPQTIFVQLRLGASGPVSPVLADSIALDVSGPEVSQLSAGLSVGPLAAPPHTRSTNDQPTDPVTTEPLPVTVSWTATDGLSGLGDATLSADCADGPTQRIEIAGSVAPETAWPWSSLVGLDAGAECDVLVVARDGVGNVTRERLSGVTATLHPAAPSETVRHAGEWRAVEDPTSPPGGLHVSDSGEATLTATLAGAQAGVIARRGPNGGVASIDVDGVSLGRVDLYAPATSGPEIVFVVDLGSDGSHELVVRPLGIGEEASGGAEVALDGFISLTTG
ncbi:hypothetical protein BH23CHL8_BH23CHL8_14100 [soil metagenome]